MTQNGISVLRWLWLMPAVLSLFSTLAIAEPALMMPRASKSLLLDITPAGQRLVAVGERGHILYSDDKGDSWTQAEVPVRQMLTAVYFATPQLGWAVGHDGLIVNTIDGGAHWVLQRDGLAEQVVLNEQKLKALQRKAESARQALSSAPSADEREELELELEDLEMDIEDARYAQTEPVFASPLMAVYFSDERRGVAVGAFNTLLTTDDGGLNWQYASQRIDNPDEFHLNAITGDGEGALWVAGEGGTIFRSGDYGASWSALDSPYTGSWFGIDYASAAGRLLLFGLRGNAFYSDDGGGSWQRSQLPDDRSLAGGGFINKRYAVLAGSVGTLLVSEDGGQTFSSRALGSRVNLAGVVCAGSRALAVGQGGVHMADCIGGSDE